MKTDFYLLGIEARIGCERDRNRGRRRDGRIRFYPICDALLRTPLLSARCSFAARTAHRTDRRQLVCMVGSRGRFNAKREKEYSIWWKAIEMKGIDENYGLAAQSARSKTHDYSPEGNSSPDMSLRRCRISAINSRVFPPNRKLYDTLDDIIIYLRAENNRMPLGVHAQQKRKRNYLAPIKIGAGPQFITNALDEQMSTGSGGSSRSGRAMIPIDECDESILLNTFCSPNTVFSLEMGSRST